MKMGFIWTGQDWHTLGLWSSFEFYPGPGAGAAERLEQIRMTF